jgi:hypothetical protein
VQQVQLHFDGNGVAAPGQLAAMEANEMVAFCLHAIESADLGAPPSAPISAKMHYSFTGIERTAVERKEFYIRWIVAKGLNELARGVRSTFEEALFFIERMKNLCGEMTTEEFNSRIRAIRSRANRLNFPELMRQVNLGLTSPLTFEGEIASLQKVRNCLEHRAGVVGAADVDDAQLLTLHLPRIKAFIWRNNEEIELEAGMQVEAGEELGVKRVTRTRSYSVGEKVIIDAADFSEIALPAICFREMWHRNFPQLFQLRENIKAENEGRTREN